MIKKRIKNKKNSCFECDFAYLMQNNKNPIISQCKINGNREVAEINRDCVFFKERTSDYVINKMIFL